MSLSHLWKKLARSRMSRRELENVEKAFPEYIPAERVIGLAGPAPVIWDVTEEVSIAERVTMLAEAADQAMDAAAAADERAEKAERALKTPELQNFAAGVWTEAAHQRVRWASDHDAGKAPADWFWLVGYLAGKALASHIKGDVDKALHHTITAAAALANWHSAILGKTDMRPGIAEPVEATPPVAAALRALDGSGVR